MLRKLLSSVAALAIVTACAEELPSEATPTNEVNQTTTTDSIQAEQNESERLYAWLDEVWDSELEFSPQSKAYLGIIDDDYSEWGDFSEQAEIEAHARSQGYLDTLRNNFDFGALNDQAQTTYRFMEYEWQMEDQLFQTRAGRYTFSPMQDVISGLTTFLINIHRISEPAHAQAYIDRLNGLGEIMGLIVEDAEEKAENGVRLPLFAYPRLTTSAQSQLSGSPFDDSGVDSALFADFKSKVAALELDDAESSALISAAESALVEVYQPAVERYLASLDTMEAEADERAGIWKVPNGEAVYASAIANYTTRNDLTADEIHNIGLSEVDRIQNEMRTIMANVGFEGDLQAFFEFVRTDDQFYYPDTEEGQQAYLTESADMIDAVMVAAPDFFDALPEAELEVRAVEEWREATATGAFYNQPALDGSRPGYYYVNLSNMRDNATYLMESLAYHEGAPGHHFQIALAQELEGLPLIQKLSFNSAYVEGWALYAEALGKDMGFFTDPYKDFGRLSYELFRAVRLVVDTGLHDKQWTREEAIAYMMANTPMTEGDITPEIERYIVWPAQALSYKIGMMTIMELRQDAMERLGENFDWGGFHDAVLSAGSVPLPLLADRVEAWVQSVEALNAE